jgi:hypothetical protein
MTPSRPDRGSPLGGLVTAGLAGWFLLTLLSQHPQRAFDRFRRFDATGLLIGNWRFFAPEPAQHDFHVLHRVLRADGVESKWIETNTIPRRRWVQAVWFPDRRQDKAMFDVCSELVVHMGTPGVDMTKSTAYAVLTESVERRVRQDAAGGDLPEGFQFVIARSGGYDETVEPDYLIVSPFVPMPRREVAA